jgi:hypothetical protein
MLHAAHVARCTQVVRVSNPSVFSIGEVVVGVSAHDILKNMAVEELAHAPAEKDKVTRMLRHLLQQRSLYPLYPPPAGAQVGSPALLATCNVPERSAPRCSAAQHAAMRSVCAVHRSAAPVGRCQVRTGFCTAQGGTGPDRQAVPGATGRKPSGSGQTVERFHTDLDELVGLMRCVGTSRRRCAVGIRADFGPSRPCPCPDPIFSDPIRF